MENLVANQLIVNNGQVVVSSRQVAETFGKEHRNVLQAIDNKIQRAEKSAGWFYESSYKDAKGEIRKEYLMNKNGFSFVVMGFTGEKAYDWQIQYIEAFEQREKLLKEIMSKELVSKPKRNRQYVATAVKDFDSTAKALSKAFHVEPAMAMLVAIDMVAPSYEVDFEPMKKLLPVAETPAAKLNPTKIAEILGIMTKKGDKPNPIKVNEILAEMGFQKKVGKEWHIEKAGEPFGNDGAYSNNGHKGWQVLWKDTVIDEIRRFMQAG